MPWYVSKIIRLPFPASFGSCFACFWVGDEVVVWCAVWFAGDGFAHLRVAFFQAGVHAFLYVAHAFVGCDVTVFACHDVGALGAYALL